MKQQEWKKWMAGFLAAGMLLSQPAAVFADPAADGSVSSSSAGEAGQNSGTTQTETGKDDNGQGAGGTETPAADPAVPADPTPSATPDVTPETTPEVTPEATPEATPEITPDPSLLLTPSAEESSDEVIIIEEETTEPEKQEETEEEEEKLTNEQLVAGQQIVHAPVIIENFRFWSVNRKYAFAKEDKTAILEDMDAEAKVIGTLPKHGLCYVLKDHAEEGPGVDENPAGYGESEAGSTAAGMAGAAAAGAGTANEAKSDDSITVEVETSDDAKAADTNSDRAGESKAETSWVYVESNGVRGFVKDEDLYSGRRAQEILEEDLEWKEDPATGELVSVLSADIPMAKEEVAPGENKAFTWMRATAEKTLIQKDYAFANDRVSIREEKNADSRAIGVLPKGALCYIVADRDSEWVYVESGDVRGFVKNEYLEKDETSYLNDTLEQEELDAVRASELASAGTEEIEDIVREQTEDADADKAPEMEVELVTTDDKPASDIELQKENGVEPAKADQKLTGSDQTADSDKTQANADAGNSTAEEEKQTADGNAAGSEANQTSDAETNTDADTDTIEATSLTAGLDKEEDPLAGVDKEKYPVYYEVTEKGEDSFAIAEQNIAPEENKAVYYTQTSPFPGTPGGKVRESLISYASEFVGNPYVWGGTSLTNGADCSGFVQSIYAQYGYNLPRTSGEQSQYGMQIPVDEAQPGDLIFYAEDGVVYHVVIYAGDGQTIEAMNESHGITFGHVLASDAVWATRVLEDTREEVVDFSADIGAQNATKEMYGKDLGEFRITYYCPCTECNGSYAGHSATGAPLIQGRTIAVDPSIIPYGTKVIIGGHVFTAEDCGGAIKGKRIDVFVNEHAMCEALGVTSAHVYLTNG